MKIICISCFVLCMMLISTTQAAQAPKAHASGGMLWSRAHRSTSLVKDEDWIEEQLVVEGAETQEAQDEQTVYSAEYSVTGVELVTPSPPPQPGEETVEPKETEDPEETEDIETIESTLVGEGTEEPEEPEEPDATDPPVAQDPPEDMPTADEAVDDENDDRGEANAQQ